MIHVVVADDQRLVRSGFRALLDSAKDIEVVGEAENGAEAVALALSVKPDVILMDIRMPIMEGIEATRRISDDPELAAIRVLILTTFDLDEYVHEALRAGASGFLLKDTPPVELLHAVRVIAAGEALIAPAITRRLIEEFAHRPGPGAAGGRGLEDLTQREVEVMALVGRACSNAEIADELHVSHGTVKTHVSHLLMKLNARDRAQLVMIAYESGLIQPGSTPTSDTDVDRPTRAG